MSGTIRNAISTEAAPKPLPPFSQGIIANGMVYLSGNVGMDPTTGRLVEGGVGARAAQICRNLAACLEAAGSDLGKVIKVNVYLTSMDNFDPMNEAYMQYFEDPKPARTCVEVRALPFGTDVEMECSAIL